MARIDVLKGELVEHKDVLNDYDENGIPEAEFSNVIKLRGVVLGLEKAVSIMEGVADEQC